MFEKSFYQTHHTICTMYCSIYTYKYKKYCNYGIIYYRFISNKKNRMNIEFCLFQNIFFFTTKCTPYNLLLELQNHSQLM